MLWDVLKNEQENNMKIYKVLAAPYHFEGTYIPHWVSSKEANALKLNSLLKTAKPVATYSATGADLKLLLAKDEGDDFYFVCALVGGDLI